MLRTKIVRSKTTLSLLAGSLLALGVSISAEAAEALRIRGTVENFEGKVLTVKTREGETAKIALKDGWKISSVAKASADAIKPGDFVGIASAPKSDGGNNALEVVIFPAAMKGTGEGSRPWDLQPGSTMTNATVANAVKAIDGPTLTLTYKGGEKTISIPEGTPIVTFAPAVEADLKSGATVFVNAEKAEDGTISSSRVVVGTKGVVPPM
ncbi:hypothetical protein [Agrobacterium vitis]|uniref:hypothetical protein n=1 Tax=Agrobacterium vitis TaxID=373 RepID=UPI0008728C3E|nr:hypothetical protein [Agrobacterium vitis]MCE6074728.1 hypothetical protein [Agrobacterium vitis]MCM2450893.1 hypothetical protein [Agrobacterium vitis]MCM2467867.1 hypothetical protein [Agrobacterium vitis]MUO68228.1 hypothetical protein [Agrobacterium vitis]MUO83554.1 hypothetical protein [Agrobacterium vitis]